MKEIILAGEIGLDVWPGQVRRDFDNAGGESVKLHISSPGGYVWDGIEIFNIIKNYSGRVDAVLSGLVASMGTYIAMAANKIEAESNAVFMIHNASTFVAGDYRDLRKAADISEGVTDLLSKEYIKKTSKSSKEIRSLMDEEAWYFGSEIKEAGFVDEMIDVEEEEDKATAVLSAKTKFQSLVAKLKEKDGSNCIEKIAALLPQKSKAKKVFVNQGKAPENSQTPKKEKMNLEEFKNKHPDLYAEVIELGKKEEGKRVSGHAKMAKTTGVYDYAMECIQDQTKSVMDDDVFAEYRSAGFKKEDLKNRTKDNPEEVETDKDTAKTDNEKVADTKKQILARMGVK